MKSNNFCQMISLLVLFIPSCSSYLPDAGKSIPKRLRFKECGPGGHTDLDEGWRQHKRISSELIGEDDSKLKEGWYRFTNGSFRMLQRNELFQNATRNRFTFQPSGSVSFQSFEFFPLPPRLYHGNTPLYVLDGEHPDIPGELIESTATECFYRSVLNIFGSPTTPINNKCDFSDPKRTNCVFSTLCSGDGKVDIKVRHCGPFFVYKLKAVRVLERNKFFEVKKNGLYSGTMNQILPEPRAPCLCQIEEETAEILNTTKCQTEFNGKEDKMKMNKARKCLKKEHKNILKEFKESATCLLRLSLRRSHEKKFAPQVIQKEIELCKEVVTKLLTSAKTQTVQ